nr:hypothetical protein GCM10020092_076230 [Actinoplanes digitatis]
MPRFGCSAERRCLDGVQVDLHGIGDLDVTVDDPVVDGVHDRPRALRQQLRSGLEVGAHGTQLTDRTLAYGHDEVLGDEDPGHAGVDDLARVGELGVLDVLRRTHDEERDVLVEFELRPLFLVQHVLDGEGMQAEDLRDAGERLLVRIVQTDPHERTFGVTGLFAQRGHIRRAGLAGTVAVEGTVHHRPTQLRQVRFGAIEHDASSGSWVVSP